LRDYPLTGLRSGCVGALLFPEGGHVDGLRWESGKRLGIDGAGGLTVVGTGN